MMEYDDNSNLTMMDGAATIKVIGVGGELELYLDTHAEDQEAFELYQTMLAVKKEAMERYAKLCAPLLQTDQLGMERYAWLDSPWPWEYMRRGEG